MANAVESVYVSVLFSFFFQHHVTMTVLVIVTKTGTITMTNRQPIQNSFPCLSFYADVFSTHVVKAQLQQHFLN